MSIPFEDRNISKDSTAKQEFLQKGYDILPVIEAGNSVIYEYEGEPQLIEVLAREGYL